MSSLSKNELFGGEKLIGISTGREKDPQTGLYYYRARVLSLGRGEAGFYEIDRNYSNSPWILNTTVKFASRAGDRKILDDLFKRLKQDNYYPEAWEGEDVNACRKLVGLSPTAAVNPK